MPLPLPFTAAALTAAIASAAALVAMHRRHHRAVGLAAGIAAGLSPAGLALLPVLLGTAIARRAAAPLLIASAPALAVVLLVIGWSPAVHDVSLWRVTPFGMDLRGLLLAVAIGGGAWIAAACSARPPASRELNEAALLAVLATPFVVPVGIEALALALPLVLAGARPTRAPLARGDNDNPLPLRAAGC